MKNVFNTRKNKGFTIAELLIAMGLFVVVISVSTTIFLKALKAQRAIVAFAQVNDNLALSIEQMAREIRTGKGFDYDDGTGNASDNSNLHFLSAQEGAVQGTPYADVYYQLDDGKIKRGIKSGGSPELALGPITTDQVNISSIKFLINNTTPPLVTILITANPVDRTLQGNYTVNLQTSISPRLYNP